MLKENQIVKHLLSNKPLIIMHAEIIGGKIYTKEMATGVHQETLVTLLKPLVNNSGEEYFVEPGTTKSVVVPNKKVRKIGFIRGKKKKKAKSRILSNAPILKTSPNA